MRRNRRRRPRERISATVIRHTHRRTGEGLRPVGSPMVIPDPDERRDATVRDITSAPSKARAELEAAIARRGGDDGGAA